MLIKIRVPYMGLLNEIGSCKYFFVFNKKRTLIYSNYYKENDNHCQIHKYIYTIKQE